jgi:hypothetical protein
MMRLDPVAAGVSSPGRAGFALYLEGPGDRGILQAWAKRLLPADARRLFDASVILGGRQPARALDHFRSLGGSRSGLRALCILDRDDGGAPAASDLDEPALEFFTWGRRHIESYLLVAPAIGRALRLPDSDGRVGRALRRHLPAEGDEEGWRDLDAKRLLAPGGPLPRALGTALRPGAIARSMRAADLHADVHACFARLREVLGLREPTFTVR